jgi:hypothetical protein
MIDDSQRHTMSERTGKHVCVRCLREVDAEEYFRNDHLCDRCAADGDYPLASTPTPTTAPKRKKNDPR